MYNPLLNKKPYGASVAGEPTEFEFFLPSSVKADKVTVVLRRGSEEFRSELAFSRFSGDGPSTPAV